MMKVIGLAGRAGSGKSTVARSLAQLPGIEWIDLDAVAWDTYAVGTDVYDRLIQTFGRGILDSSGSINRRRLAQEAFANSQSRQILDSLVHPAVAEAVERLILDARNRGIDILLIEGALLATSPYVDRSVYHRILWLDASDETRRNRLQTMGRSDHADRNQDVLPQGDYVSVSAEGSIKDVAARILKAIAETRNSSSQSIA